ncbi:MAG: hypothetical protein RTV31_11470 [Candidatus Thorarchaeota archaeon]
MNRKYRSIGIISVLLVGSLGVAIYLTTSASSITLTELGQIDTGGFANFVEVAGDIAYVLDTNEEHPVDLVLIDISDPTNPVELSSWSDGGHPWELDVAGNFVYVADGFEGLEIINVTDPENPSELCQYDGSGEIYDVQIVDDIAYVADWNWGLLVLNVSDPASPDLLASKSITGACLHVYVEGNFVYATDHRSEQTGLVIYDITNPANPILVGNYLPNYDIWNPIALGDYIYTGNHALGGADVLILNATIPNDIQEVCQINSGGSTFAIAVIDDVAYMADYQLGLVIVDVSDLTAPTLMGRYYDGGNSQDVCVVGDIIYVADGADGLEIIQIS